MKVYLDNAATTKLEPKVLDKMLPFLKEEYGNPGSFHDKGLVASNAIDEARANVAGILNCSEEEIIFTGSGTESDNLAIFGFLKKNKGKHIITTEVEHHAVEGPFKELEKLGYKTTFLGVDGEGLIDLKELESAITDDTALVSIIYANNEIGTLQDIKAISKICKGKGVVFHTDACQATSYEDIDVESLGVDLMTLNGSKINGPKGIGMLYKREGVDIAPIILGGGQENGLRSGTENVANIIGFAEALKLATEHKDAEVARLTTLRDRLAKELLKMSETRLNGHAKKRLPNNLNISFLNVEGESILLLLNEIGIYASTGSACSSQSLDPSHVLLALGLPPEVAHGSIRFTLGIDTTEDQIDHVIKEMPRIIKKLREMSPLHHKMEEVVGDKDDKTQ